MFGVSLEVLVIFAVSTKRLNKMHVIN